MTTGILFRDLECFIAAFIYIVAFDVTSVSIFFVVLFNIVKTFCTR